MSTNSVGVKPAVQVAFVGEESGGLGQGIAFTEDVGRGGHFDGGAGEVPGARGVEDVAERGGGEQEAGLLGAQDLDELDAGDGVGLDGEVGVVHPDEINAEAFGGGLGLGSAAGGQFAGRDAVQGGVAVGDGDDGDVIAARAMARQGAADGELGVAGTG